MKVQFNYRSVVVEIISMSLVLLFVYAAASKLMDFQHFKIELGQSPLLSAFVGWIAVLVPLVELLICLLIIIPKYRLMGLLGAYGLMLMFSVYIFIILNYTSFVPCSCGGVLEKLGWKSHMIFNIVFVLLALLGIIYQNGSGGSHNRTIKNTRLRGLLCAITITSISIVAILFMFSENIIHYHNKLTRRFPHSPIKQEASADLKLNSFYIAGADSSHIYLGNATTPLKANILNVMLKQTQIITINLNRVDLPFRGARISIVPPYFYVTDGTVPCIFRGTIDNWQAKLVYYKGEYFTTALAIDSASIAVVTNSKKTGDNILGVINTGKNKNTILNPEILQKQIDGVFDTDGHLLYSERMKQIIYLYAYRNQYTISDQNLKIIRRGNTLDTITQAKLDIAKDEKYKQRKLSKPPLFVNKKSAICKNLLFVNSAVPGLYEDDRMWKRTSIIDVYDLAQNSYLMSFTINDLGDKKIKDFLICNDQLYVLINNQIIRYRMDSQITSKYIK